MKTREEVLNEASDEFYGKGNWIRLTQKEMTEHMKQGGGWDTSCLTSKMSHTPVMTNDPGEKKINV